MAKAATDQSFEGEPIIGNRIKVLGASGVKTDVVGHKGEWARITMEGPLGATTFDPQKDGWVREIECKASQQFAKVEIIEQPPEPAPEGQTTLEDLKEGVRDADGNVVSGPEADPED